MDETPDPSDRGSDEPLLEVAPYQLEEEAPPFD